jgi:hypothetical protein
MMESPIYIELILFMGSTSSTALKEEDENSLSY